MLGLGGWFLGVLIVITTLPGVALDDQVLAALSIGLPVGLGIYWPWVHRDWSLRTKAVGFAAAVAGALVGAWLGFGVVDGLLAIVTTIVGATAGGNLAVLALDMARDAQATRERAAGRDMGEALQARPSVG